MKFSISNVKPYTIILGLATLVYLVTAFNSLGYYQADEHYQIVEFAGSKLQPTPPYALAWEYTAKIRPALQPTICAGILKGLSSISITDPYSQAFFLRLVTAILALLTIHLFVKQTENQFEDKRIKTAYQLLSYLLWFIPFISVRFSSETWSGLMFLLALAIFLNPKHETKKPYIVGLVFGISFLFRFQSALLVLGFGLWLLVVNKTKINFIAKMAAAFTAAIAIGVLVDSWFYNEWVFTPWNYLYTTLLKTGAPDFGASPWFFYLKKLIQFPTYFVGIPLALALVVHIVRAPKSIYLWCIVPFIVAHSLIPHKEERFLFSIVYLFPIIMISSYAWFIDLVKRSKVAVIFNYVFVSVFVVVNAIGLIAMSQKAAGIGRMAVTKYIHDHYRGHPMNLIYCNWSNPYDPWYGLPARFYLDGKMSTYHIGNLCQLNDSIFQPHAENILILRKQDLDYKECKEAIAANHFVLKMQSIPVWEEWLNKRYRGFDNNSILVLYLQDTLAHH